MLPVGAELCEVLPFAGAIRQTAPVRRTASRRSLRAVVFIDTVDSTSIVSELGDSGWQTLLTRELTILRHLLRKHRGREVDVAGDGVFAMFDEPIEAVRFGADATESVRELGLEVRVGVHFGEVDFAERRPAGIVVHTGARTMSTGGGGDVIVTQTVHDLVSGSGVRFADHGIHELKGIPGSWHLYKLATIDGRATGATLDEVAAIERRRAAADHGPVVRRRTFIAGITAALAAGSAAIYLSTRDPEDPSSPPSGVNRIIRFDPSEGDEAMSRYVLPHLLGELPGIAVGEGGVWASDSALHHLDPRDGSIEGQVDIHTSSVQVTTRAIAIGFGDVWVASAFALLRVDPADDDVLDRLDLPGTAVTGLAAGRDDLWLATADGSLRRIAVSDVSEIDEALDVGGPASDLVIVDGGVWVTNEFGSILRVDERTGAVTESLEPGGSLRSIAATDAHLWVVDPEGLVIVVDIDGGRIRKSISVGGTPIDVTSGLGAVWVADTAGERIVRLDETTLSEDGSFDLSGPPAAIAADEEQGLLWVRTSGGRSSN